MAAKQDMGTDSIGKLMLRLTVPAVVAQLVNLLYSIVDRIYIGHIPDVGGTALTGMGLCSAILMLISAFAMLAGSGCVPLAAIAMGQENRQQAERIMGNCFSALLICAAVLTVGFYTAAPWLLRLFGASDSTLPYALTYGRIYILGSVFVLIVLGLNAFISTQGFAKNSMLTTIIGAALNIVLDPILIFGFDMGVAGAALATVISQTVSAIWVLLFLTGKKTILRLRLMKLEPKVIMPCLGLGFSSFVTMATESLLAISFTANLSRYGGDMAVGAMTILTSTNQLLTSPVSGISQGSQPIISFNFGAGNRERVKKAFRIQFLICTVYSMAFWTVLMLFPGVFTGMFTSDAELASYASWALRIFLAGAFSFSVQISCQQSFRALGQAKISLFLACLRKLILLIPLIYIMPAMMEDKVFAIFLAEPISDILAAAAIALCFFLRFNKILEKGPKPVGDGT